MYQALYADNIDFDQILITPVMISDHMPNRLVDALSHLLHEPHESQERYRSTLGINRPLLDQSARPLLAYEYGSGWSETRAHTMTAVQPRSALNHDTRYGSNQYTSNQSQPIEQDRTDSHSINPSGLNSKGSTVVPVDLAVDDWIGTAPLATPEVASESSSVCSHSRTGSMAKRNVKTVSELIQAAVTTTGPNDPRFGVQWNGAMPKLDLELNIDVNALFDQWNANNPSLLLDVRAVADSPVSASENPVNMKNGLTTDSNDADLKTWKTQDPESNHDRKPCANVNALQASLPAIKKMGRASSLRRAGSVSSGKRVAFESKALMDGRVQSKSPNSTLIASCSLFGRVETAIRRVNSERISSTSTKRRVFAKLPTASRRTTNQSTSFEISNNQLTNAMTNTSGQLSALGSSSNRGTDLKVNEEETENWTNEQLEQELQRMLVTKSFAFHHHLEMSPDSDPSLMTSKSTKNSTES